MFGLAFHPFFILKHARRSYNSHSLDNQHRWCVTFTTHNTHYNTHHVQPDTTNHPYNEKLVQHEISTEINDGQLQLIQWIVIIFLYQFVRSKAICCIRLHRVIHKTEILNFYFLNEILIERINCYHFSYK